MSKRTRQYIGILAALAAYYLVHEGAHLLYALLTAAALLIAVSMTGCTKLSEAPNNTSMEVDVPTESDGAGVYVKLERGDADDMLLGEDTFLYDVAQEKLYVTISEDSVTCSTSDAADAPADVPPVLTLPILDEIDTSVTVGTSGSSLAAIQAAVNLLDWGVNTGLGTDEIGDAASTWLAAKNNDLTDCLKKLELVDDAYRKLLTDEARELLDSAGCEEVEITWGSEPVEPVEAIMQAAGLRG